MKQKISPKSIALVFGVLILCFVIGFYVFAWTEPSGPPPTDNVAPPITSESDPIFSGSAAATLTFASTSQWNTAYIERKQWDGGSVNLVPATGRTSLGLGSLAILGSVSGGAGGTITDGTITDVDISAFAAIAGSKISGWNATNWNTAYTWGDHSTAGYATEIWVTGQNYLTPGDESDPIFSGSVAAGILSTDITNWDTAYTWGDHAAAGYATEIWVTGQGYLTSETDPQVGTLTINKWCTSNAAGTQVICTSDAPSSVNNYVTGVSFNTTNGVLTLTRSGLSDLTQDLDGRYLTSYDESDPIFSGSVAAGILSTDITNWDTAYTWGDHAAAGYATEIWVTGQGYLTPGDETDPVWTADKPSYATQVWVTGQGYLTSYTETDPQVNTLTSGKWCTTNGSVINCTSDAPSGVNNYVDSITFNTATGVLTLGRLGLTSLTEDLDGRYLTNESDPIFSGTGISGSGTTNQVAFFTGLRTIGSDSGLYWDNTNKRLGIGTTPGYKLDVVSGGSTTARFGTASTDEVEIGGGAGKLTVGTIDPIFNIDGKKYATYMADYAGGVRIETSGIVQLNPEGKYIIDFDNLEKGSDLWLFWQASNKDLTAVSILLTSSFEGKTWYKKDWYKKDGNILIIYGDKKGEVSYRLSAPRVDYQKWDNLAENQTLEGIEVIK